MFLIHASAGPGSTVMMSLHLDVEGAGRFM
jgi:hypothetical protein